MQTIELILKNSVSKEKAKISKYIFNTKILEKSAFYIKMKILNKLPKSFEISNYEFENCHLIMKEDDISRNVQAKLTNDTLFVHGVIGETKPIPTNIMQTIDCRNK